MLFMFTPYSFLFFSIYLSFLFSLSTVSSFYYYWFVIELIILLLIGLSYTLFTNSYSQLIMYFLIQTLASFFILIFYVLSVPFLLTLSFVLKLSIFPFFTWYLNLVYRFPNFIFFLVSTLHKLPVLLIISIFSLPLDSVLFWLSLVLTTFFSGAIMMSLTDFRMLLVLSSIGNNSWMLLSQIVSVSFMLLYLFFYSLFLYLVLTSFTGLSKYLGGVQSVSSNPYTLSLWLISLSGMPPFPIFFLNIFIILFLFCSYDINYFFIIFLLFSSFMFMAYVQSLIKLFIYSFSVNLSYFLKY